MKQTTRLLALSALVLAVVLAAIGAPALNAPSVAFAQEQGQVPIAPVITAQRSGTDTINLTWTPVTGAVSYELYAHHPVTGWMRLDGGAADPLTANTFPHTGLEIDTLYHYQVRGVNAQGNVGAYSARANEVAGQNAPDRPSLTATPGYQVITVTWPAVTNADSYVLYAWDQTWSLIDTVTGTSYDHTGLTVGQTYYYQARAMNANNVLGALSALANATVLSTPNISAPTSFSAVRGDEQVTLTWAAPSNTAGQTIAKYEYRYVESGGAFPTTWKDAGNVLTVTVTELDSGTQYNFEVRAVSETDAVGNTASRSATPSTVPGAPTLTATATHNSVTLTWTAPSDDGGADITSYRIQRENDDATWTTRYNPPSSVTTWRDSGLTNGIEYTYRIFAINLAGMSDWTPISVDTLSQAPRVPSAPLSVMAEAAAVADGGGKVTLDWQTPVFNGGSAITIYQYQYRETTSGSYHPTFWRDASEETEVEVTLADGLERAKTYTFRVRARNAIGAGPPSVETDPGAIVFSTAPTGMPVLTISRASDVNGVNGDDRFALNWKPLGNDDDGDGVSTTNIIGSYTLQWKSSRYPDEGFDTTDWPDDDADTTEDTFQGETVQASDTLDNRGRHEFLDSEHANSNPLEPNTTYTYRVRAVNPSGSGPWSNEEYLTTLVNLPSAPAMPTGAGLDSDSIEVSWMAPAKNGGDTITAYELEVRTDNSTFTETDGNTPIGPLPATRTKYTHDGVRPMVDYFYRVRAVNSAGKGTWSESSLMVSTASAAQGTHSAPMALEVTPEDDEGLLNLGWMAPTVTLGQGETSRAAVSRYEIQFVQRDASTDLGDNVADDLAALEALDDGEAILIPTPPTNTMYSHTGLPGGTRYVYRVRAVNSAGNGEFSTPVAGIVDPRAPDAPTLTATAVGASEVLLEWNVPADNGTPILGFVIQQWDPTVDTDNDGTAEGAWGGNVSSPVNLLTAADQTENAELTLFTVDTLVAGETYYFRIRTDPKSDWSGDTPDDSTTGAASAMTPSGVPGKPTLADPDAVTDAMDDDDVGSISLTITAPTTGGSDLTGYELQRWYGGQWSTVSPAPAADAKTYTNSGLEPGDTYYYALRAMNATGAGPWSDVVSAVATAGNPDTPTLAATAIGETRIQLTWNEPEDNGTTIMGYQIQRWNPAANSDAGGWHDNSPATNLLAGNDTVTEFVDTGRMPGETYYYRIRALPQVVDSDGDGMMDDEGWSAEDKDDAVSEDTLPGNVPEAPVMEATGTTAVSITVNWVLVPAAENGGSAITGYEVYKWTGSQWVSEATRGAADEEYVDTGLTGGTKHYYIVRAVNSNGPGKWSSYASGTTTPAAADAPVLTATVRGTNSIQLSWTVPELNGAAHTGYTLARWDGNSYEAIEILTLAVTTTLYVDEGDLGDNSNPADQDYNPVLDAAGALKPGTQYWYRIQTASVPASTAFSNVASATTVKGVPSRPTLTDPDITHDSITLKWTAPESDGGDAIIHYEVQLWDSVNHRWDRIRLVAAAHLTYEHDNLTPETRYVYRVRAQNRAPANSGFGAWSTIFPASTTAEPEE